MKLDSIDGREVKGPRDGSIDYFYDVNGGGARLVLAPQARTLLLRTQAQPGDTVEVVKYSNDRWDVHVLSDAHEPEPVPQGPRMVAPSPAQRNYQNGAAARQLSPERRRSRSRMRWKT